MNCHVWSLERDFYLGTPGPFNRVFNQLNYLLFLIEFIKNSFNIGLVEVESCIVSKNNICDNIF
jgi:hypothetical protein